MLFTRVIRRWVAGGSGWMVVCWACHTNLHFDPRPPHPVADASQSVLDGDTAEGVAPRAPRPVRDGDTAQAGVSWDISVAHWGFGALRELY